MDEPGNPDELKQALRNWLDQAASPLGTLPENTDPVDWAISQFIAFWQAPIRSALRSLESSLSEARRMCEERTDPSQIRDAIDYASQVIGEDLRPAVGLYDWNDPTA